jgi:hypothetical protein
MTCLRAGVPKLGKTRINVPRALRPMAPTSSPLREDPSSWVPLNRHQQYMCLAHPAWSWRWHLMLHLIMLLGEDLVLLPIHHYGIASLRHIFKCPLSTNGWQTSSIWYSRDAHYELTLLDLDDDHHSMSSSHGLYEISLFEAFPWENTKPTQINTKIHIWCVSSQIIIDKAYDTTRSRDHMPYIIYAPCVDQPESNV